MHTQFGKSKNVRSRMNDYWTQSSRTRTDLIYSVILRISNVQYLSGGVNGYGARFLNPDAISNECFTSSTYDQDDNALLAYDSNQSSKPT